MVGWESPSPAQKVLGTGKAIHILQVFRLTQPTEPRYRMLELTIRLCSSSRLGWANPRPDSPKLHPNSNLVRLTEFHSYMYVCWFWLLPVAAIEFSERLTYFGMATNLIIYLTKILHQDLKTAAKNVNYWAGVTTMMPLVGGFLADAYLGRFSAILASSIIYLMVISISMHLSFLSEFTASSHGGPHWRRLSDAAKLGPPPSWFLMIL